KNLLLTIPNLELLNFSNNQLTNSSVLASGLLTLRNLKILDFLDNQLVNGSMLAPALSTLRNLTILNLGGNNFTTEDRLAIWNATSFLSQSPFYLDEDSAYTTYYLQSLPSNKTSLNFAGLILNNSTAFETIMPQVVEHFTNLTELNLSNNKVGSLDLATKTPRGIVALNASLPHLSHLQSLKISNNGHGSDSPEITSYYQNFSYTIGQLPNLHSLDLSLTWFFYAGCLGKGLNKSASLTSVNLEGCWNLGIGERGNWQGGMELINGLKAHSNLTNLNLEGNPIGVGPFGNSTDPNSTLALADALSFWPQLESLNLNSNYIGFENSSSASHFLEKLANLSITVHKKTGKTLEASLLYGIYNITWTNEAHVFQNLTQTPILKACAKQLCWGGNITTTQSKTPKHELPEARKIKPVTLSQSKKLSGSPLTPSQGHSLQEELSVKPLTNTHQLQEVLMTEPVTSSSSPLVPFYQPLVNSLKSWFSPHAWMSWGDRKLDSVIHVITSYSEKIVKNAPGYYSGMLDNNKSPIEGRNKSFRNYPVPHFHALDQGEPLDVQRFNYMQALPQPQGLNHTSLPPMLNSGSPTLMISK
nr:hypothetical protein [Alphaproteobacteria bacterium]